MLKYSFVLLALVLFAPNALAWSFECRRASAGQEPFCKYIGNIKRLYINDNGVLLVYFERPVDLSKAKIVGLSAKVNKSAGIKITEKNRFYVDKVFALLLAAKSHEKQVSFHMNAVEDGYLKIDRVWLDD